MKFNNNGNDKMTKYITVIITIIFISGCSSTFENIGSGLGNGVVSSLENRDSLLSALGGSLTKGAIDSISLKKLEMELNATIDSVLSNASKKSNKEITILLDSAIGVVLNRNIKLLGITSREQLEQIRNSLLGFETRNYISKLRNELLGDSTNRNLQEIRDELLGENTSLLVSKLISDAMDTLMVKYGEFQPIFSRDLRNESNFFKDNLTYILIVIGALVAGLIILCYRLNKKRKDYLGISELLTYEIHKIPNQSEYDELTTRIQDSAQKDGYEKNLRQILENKGLN